MKKSSMILMIIAMFVISSCLSACGNQNQSTPDNSQEATTEVPEITYIGAAYGYTGDDPMVLAVYKYMAEEVSKSYEKADISIPTVAIVFTDSSDENDVKIYGDFWVENYNVKDDILECESGGNYPGVMHLKKDGDNYTVTKFDICEDGSGFDKSAKELFGDHYDDFMKIFSDSDARDQLRKKTVSDYVKMNGLAVTSYQDYGWDPVELEK